jgi:hypothetical protein
MDKRTQRGSKLLWVALEPHEVRDASDELARQVNYLREAKDNHKHEKKLMKEKEDDLQTEIVRLAELVSVKGQERLVDIEDIYDYDRLTVATVRLDTGQQVAERTMTYEERQMPLQLPPPAAAPVEEPPSPEQVAEAGEPGHADVKEDPNVH